MPLLSSRGFTLVELAISLMVIGLLLGGVLKGRELIENVKTTSVMKQLKSYDAASVVFLERYGGLPGDTSNASSISAISSLYNSGNNDGIVGGVMTGDNGTIRSNKEEEICRFFTHLSQAKLIEEQFGGGMICYTDPTHEFARRLFPATPFMNVLVSLKAMGNTVSSLTAIEDFTPFTHYYNMTPMSIMHAHAFDKKFDDGYSRSGNVILVPNTVCSDNNGVYNLQSGNPQSGSCHLLIRASF